MTVANNDFEEGSNGVTISAANSGGTGENAFDVVNIPATCAITYSNTHVHAGAMASSFTTGGTAGTPYLDWTTTIGTQTEIWMRCYLYVTANPAATRQFMRANPGSGGGGVGINLNGKVVTLNNSNAVVATSTNAVNLNAWFRLELHLIQSSTTGTIEARLYNNADAEIAAYTEQLSTANVNTGTAAYTNYLIGVLTSVANFGPVYVDDVAVSTTGWIGPSQHQQTLVATETPTKSLGQQAQRTFLLPAMMCGSIVLQAIQTLAKNETPVKSTGQQVQMALSKSAANTAALNQQAQQAQAKSATSVGSLNQQAQATLLKAASSAASIGQRVSATFGANDNAAAGLNQQARAGFARNDATTARLNQQAQAALGHSDSARASLGQQAQQLLALARGAVVSLASFIARSLGGYKLDVVSLTDRTQIEELSAQNDVRQSP